MSSARRLNLNMKEEEVTRHIMVVTANFPGKSVSSNIYVEECLRMESCALKHIKKCYILCQICVDD